MLTWLLTGGLVPVLIILLGLFFLIYMKGYPWRAPKKMLAALRGGDSKSGVSPFRAVMLALAGTLGVGNIVGVANAVWIGGAGAVFWMWVSALLAMILKYAEILLAVAHRRQDRNGHFFGGAVYYIKDHFLSRRHFRAATVLPAIFAALILLDALSMGCVIQADAIASSLKGVVNIPVWAVGIMLVLLTLPLLIKGSRGISALTEYLVPIMTAGYIILSVAVLILRSDRLGDALCMIFEGAFTFEGVSGGVLGFLTCKALRVGTMRGLLSNEAGCGTAPTAHASADAKSPASQGVWGIFEVFVDTILLCTATALVILVSYDEVALLGGDGVMMTIRAYSTVLGNFASWFFCGAIFCFGYATLLCWGGYGLENLRFLTQKKRWYVLYYLAFGICILIGANGAPSGVWDVADFAIAALTVMNLCVLFLMRREIRAHTLPPLPPTEL